MKTCLRIACASLLSTLAIGVGCAPAASTKADNGATPAPGTDGGSVDPSKDGGTPGTDGGPTGAAATSCSTGALFAGNPVYDGQPLDRPAPGTGIHADPPLQWQNLVFSGNQLYTRDQGEVWGTDVSAASPVENRIAGLNLDGGKFAYTDGPCAAARIGKIEGLGALPDGSLLVADVLGNGVLKISNPTAATCKVDYYAGNHTANPDIDLNAPVPNQGDVDGPGATAKFDSPGAMTVDDAGNAYVFDQGNRKVKKIANDAAHTVTTLAKLAADGPDRFTNMTRVGGSVYGIGTDGTEAIILGIDTTSGAMTTVLRGKGDKFPPMDSVQFPALAGITSDGQGLIISGKGFVWYLTTKGVLTPLAGSGLHIDFPENGYDPKVPHPALDLQLEPQTNGSLIGSSDYVTYHQGAVYFRGHHQGTAAFVQRISCP